MKTAVRAMLLLAVAAFATFAVEARGAENGTGISHVILIGVDGGGAFFKDADTPNMDKIFANGSVSYKVVTSKPTISAQSWGSMLHGVTPEFHGLTNSIVGSRPYPTDSIFPSVFRVIRENMPDAKLAAFCHWNPVNIGIIEDGIGVEKKTGKDAEVTQQACDYLKTTKPTLLFVHYDEVDGAGHSKGYGSQRHLDQLHTTDGYVAKIYEAAKEAGILDSTLFMVSADHGGNGTGHGGWTDGEKYIIFAATGPGVVKGGEAQDMGVRDISSVILYALGLADKQPETWTSRVPAGVFEGVGGGERPEFKVEYAYPHRTHETKPTPDADHTAAAILGKDRVVAYFPLDKSEKDALDKTKTELRGRLYYEDGFFGSAAHFDDGSIALPDLQPGKSSFSIACWIKSGHVDGDAPIIANKDWRSGGNPGFSVALRASDIKFNVGTGKARFDREFRLPLDFVDGWIYFVLVVDRDKNEIRGSYDFRPFETYPMSDAVKDADFSALPVSIAQDGTGNYRTHFGAVLDEVLIINGVLTDDDVAKLKELYQK